MAVNQEKIDAVRADGLEILERLEKVGVLLSSYGNHAATTSLADASEYYEDKRRGELFSWRSVATLVHEAKHVLSVKCETSSLALRTSVASHFAACAGSDARTFSHGDVIMARLVLRMRTLFESKSAQFIDIGARCLPGSAGNTFIRVLGAAHAQ
jgi:hypothetical protein